MDLLRDATEEQRIAIQHRDGAAFVSAAPGSGKTRVITYRCAHLLQQGVNPANIVGITFTNKAANEMKSRVKQLVGQDLAKRVWLSTFHSFCVRLLHNAPTFYRIQRNFGIADESDAKQLVTLAIAHVTGKLEKDVRALDGTGDIRHVRRWISNQKNALQTPDDVYADEEADFKEFIPYYREYNNLLQQSNLLDFDDLIMRTVLRLRDGPEQQRLLAEHLHYLMVDEWQDTNRTQFELVRLLTHLRGNVFVVGDDDQSIYGFRGADPRNSQDFFKAFPDTKTYYLQKNFRSVPGIADLANAVITNNDRQHSKRIVPHKAGGRKPQMVELPNREDEAGFIINTIVGMVKKGGVSWKDFAVIYRIRSFSRPLEDAAVARNVPHRVVGALSFYSRAAVKDILCYGRLLLSPHDDAAFTRIHNKPARGIGPVHFARFSAVADEHGFSLLKTLRKGMYKDMAKGGALQGFRQLKRLYRGLYKMGPGSARKALEYIIRYSGYRHYAEDIKDEDRRARVLEDLQELVSAADAFDQRRRKKSGLAAFLEHAALMQQEDRNEDQDVVLMMTAHAAKGLEFPHVFVCGVTEGALPLEPRSDDGGSVYDPRFRKEHYEEERRVFYVAATRAEKRLWLTYPAKRFLRGSVVDCKPSRFLREAGETVEFVNMNRYTYRSRNPIHDGGADEIIRARRGEGDSLILEKETRRRRT